MYWWNNGTFKDLYVYYQGRCKYWENTREVLANIFSVLCPTVQPCPKLVDTLSWNLITITHTTPVTQLHLLVGGLEHVFFSPYIGNNHPNWLIFSEGLKPPNSLQFWVFWTRGKPDSEVVQATTDHRRKGSMCQVPHFLRVFSKRPFIGYPWLSHL